MNLFIFDRGGSRDGSPAEMQQVMQKWMAWFKRLGEEGHIKDQGQPLERSGKLVRGKQKTIVDGPFAEVKDVVGGYTLIQARDLEQAVEFFGSGRAQCLRRRQRSNHAGIGLKW